jgi:hypothetical protein
MAQTDVDVQCKRLHVKTYILNNYWIE